MNEQSAGPVSPNTRFRLSSNTLVKSFNDRVALVHMKTRRIQVLNNTATDLWKFVEAGNTRGEMEDLMMQQFSVGREELSQEIDRILQMLQQEGLIEIDQ